MSSSSVTVRISKVAHQRLSAIASKQGIQMQDVLDRAIEEYRRAAFLDGLNADFAALRADSREWQIEQDERRIFDFSVDTATRQSFIECVY